MVCGAVVATWRVMDEKEGENEKQEACILIMKVGEGRFCRGCEKKI